MTQVTFVSAFCCITQAKVCFHKPSGWCGFQVRLPRVTHLTSCSHELTLPSARRSAHCRPPPYSPELQRLLWLDLECRAAETEVKKVSCLINQSIWTHMRTTQHKIQSSTCPLWVFPLYYSILGLGFIISMPSWKIYKDYEFMLRTLLIWAWYCVGLKIWDAFQL